MCVCVWVCAVAVAVGNFIHIFASINDFWKSATCVTRRDGSNRVCVCVCELCRVVSHTTYLQNMSSFFLSSLLSHPRFIPFMARVCRRMPCNVLVVHGCWAVTRWISMTPNESFWLIHKWGAAERVMNAFIAHWKWWNIRWFVTRPMESLQPLSCLTYSHSIAQLIKS